MPNRDYLLETALTVLWRGFFCNREKSRNIVDQFFNNSTVK